MANSINDNGIIVVPRYQFFLDRGNITDVDHVLVIHFDSSLQAQVPELIFDFVYLILFVDVLKIPQHALRRAIPLAAPDLSLLQLFNLTQDLLLLFDVECDAVVLE